MSDKNKNSGKPTEIEIPVDGSLGILAYGYKGIFAWRKKRDEYIKQLQQNKKNG